MIDDYNNVTLTIKQGTSWALPIVFKNKDLGGWTAEMHIKKKVKQTTPDLELSTVNGKILIETDSNTSDTTITLSLTVADTDGLDEGKYLFDLALITDGGDTVDRPLRGTIEIVSKITVL